MYTQLLQSFLILLVFQLQLCKKRYSDLKIIILNTLNSQIYIIKQFNNHDACE